MKVVIWWIRRALRVQHNPLVIAAAQFALPILPLYIYDPDLIDAQHARGRFHLQAVEGLRQELIEQGATLISAYGSIEAIFQTLMQQVEVVRVITEKDVTPRARDQLKQLADWLPILPVNAHLIYEPGAVQKPDGGAYQKYSAFRNRWLANPIPKRDILDSDVQFIQGDKIKLPFDEYPPGVQRPESFRSQQAQANLKIFMQGPVQQYENLRNRVDLDDTSHCSHFLRFGLLSPLETLYEVNAVIQRDGVSDKKTGPQSWRDELIWREFFMHLMDSYDSETDRLKNRDGTQIAWRDDPRELSAWQQGLCGYPMVDAAMRQLQQTGWMPGRARMVVASFLTKDLFLWWRHGETWFLRHLVDGDPAANHGNWQWVAGIGTDAAPFFRIFNPVLQSKKFDPKGTYLRTWLPELARVPEAYLHDPWRMNTQEQSAAHCRLGKDYPKPIVDHNSARQRALDLYRRRH